MPKSMQKLQAKDVDCFYYQQSQCPYKKCTFQHRESAKTSKHTCKAWQLNVCRNKSCTDKHLNKEALRMFFRCTKEKKGQCDNLSCIAYHEKPRIVQQPGIRVSGVPSPVPKPPRNKWKINKVLEKNTKQLQNMVRSGNQFLKVVLGYIVKAVKSEKLDREKAKQYTREFLHSILFLGYINIPPIEHQEFLSDIPPSFTDKYSDIFRIYKTHIPRRPPYSVLLEMVVHCIGDQHAEDIFDSLWELNREMFIPQNSKESHLCGNDFAFASRVISYCYFYDEHVTRKKTRNYFGASISCKGKLSREVMIDISCCETWNKHVALAVCAASIYGNNIPYLLPPPSIYSAAVQMFQTEVEVMDSQGTIETESIISAESTSSSLQAVLQESPEVTGVEPLSQHNEEPMDMENPEQKTAVSFSDSVLEESSNAVNGSLTSSMVLDVDDSDSAAEVLAVEPTGNTSLTEELDGSFCKLVVECKEDDKIDSAPSYNESGPTDSGCMLSESAVDTTGDSGILRDEMDATNSEEPLTDPCETSSPQGNSSFPIYDPLQRYSPKPPCEKCITLFPNTKFNPEPTEIRYPPTWEYGNCAECESFSRLFNAEPEVTARLSWPEKLEVVWDRQYGQQILAFSGPVVLIEQRRQRLIDNLKKTLFTLGEQLLFFDPSDYEAPSHALVRA
ncbi:uncharacterized protein LOC122799248 [Protopterus annectens]|uniref:uncharacterized protein LOC122799248 n=1 Tax=Protopterus annectens TaxID=7888 RepID=UPI001CFACFF9|nr:uncharacterized protein LOC122799248 [Protopterus annectens]XP_043924125.1 uncharacterized protein LOC122799248 [Protopterus annectens]